MASLLLDKMPGRESPKALSLQRVGQDLPWAATSCGINALGGLIAEGLDRKCAEKWPDNHGAPTFVVTITAVGLKLGFSNQKPLDNVVREVAAGMAGWVGADVFYAFRDAVFRVAWKAKHSYKIGDHVKYDGKVWQASKDIPYNPPTAGQAEPGKDSRWVEVNTSKRARAQGYRYEDLKEQAQAFMADKRRVDAIAEDVAELLADNGHLNDDERTQFVESCQKILNDVIGQFAA